MSIRRKSTTHDLATLRLHPDGSRVQQSSVNARHRTAGSTVVDSRGNWIASDAGGKSSVKIRSTNKARIGEFIDLYRDEEKRHQSKGKQPALDTQISDEEPAVGRLNTRARQRLSFLRDLSFLDPAPASVSALKQDADSSDATSAREPIVSFPDPAPDLLKAIHHFANCYYRERGQLLDGSRNYRGEKKERRRQSQENVHTLAANACEQQDNDSVTEPSETEEETSGGDEGESEVSGKEESKTKGDAYQKDMYKALDGSALMAIGIVLQEYAAHTLLSGAHTSEEPRHPKRRKTG